MRSFGKCVGRLAAFLAVSEFVNWLLVQLSGFLHVGTISLVLSLFLVVMSSNSVKSRTSESRINSVVSQLGVLQSKRGTTSGFSGTDSSSSMAGNTRITYDAGSSNQGGGPGSQTSGQIGSASPHVHDMTHFHTESTTMQNLFNSLQSSFALVDSRLGAMYTALQNAGIL